MPEPTHAGGVVYRRTTGAVEFLLVSARRSRAWVLPKGHIEAGETAEQAAVREVEEEAGVIATVERELDRVTLKVNGESQLIHFYLMPYVRETQAHESRQIAWLSRRDAVARLTFAEARKLVNDAALSLGIE